MPQLFDCHSVAFNLERPALDYSSTTQVVAAITDVLLPVGGLLKISSAAAVVMNASSVSTANAKAGDLLTILNVNARLAATDYLTLTRGTYLKLGAATRVRMRGAAIAAGAHTCNNCQCAVAVRIEALQRLRRFEAQVRPAEA